MNPVPELSPHLKQLRLSGILDSLEARNRQAIDSQLAYTEFLSLLIQDMVQIDESIFIRTRGYGIGPYGGMNEVLSPMWQALDVTMTRSLGGIWPPTYGYPRGPQ